ncbi:helical backbone metal receptor [Chloroflexota bacterium]
MSDTPHEERYSLSFTTDTPPQRVISLVPSITESLFDLQLGDRVIGITDYCIHPQDKIAHLPRLGGPKNPDIEQIIALQPDLVLMNAEDNRLQDAQKLQDQGIAVWTSHPRTVQEAINLLWEFMNVFDEPSMSERVRWIERQMDWVASAARVTAPVKVFVPIWYDPWMSFTAETFMHNLLLTCGGLNIFAEYRAATRYPHVTLEEIIEAQPAVVLLPGEPYEFNETHVAEIAALNIPAAQTNRIHLVDGALLTWHGTRLAQALIEIPPLLSSGSTED